MKVKQIIHKEQEEDKRQDTTEDFLSCVCTLLYGKKNTQLEENTSDCETKMNEKFSVCIL